MNSIINLRERKRTMCFKCKRITHHTLGVKNELIPHTDIQVEILAYFCNVCKMHSVTPHAGLVLYQNAIKEYKKKAPSIEDILKELPEKRQNRWVNHFNESEGLFVLCDCPEDHKGVDCDNHLSKYYYTKQDWNNYIKEKSKQKK